MRSFLVIPVAALAISATLWWSSQDRPSAASQEPEPSASVTPAVTEKVEASSVEIEPAIAVPPAIPFLRIATCTLLPVQEQCVASQIDGLLVKIKVTPGQKVVKGQCLARLDDSKLLPQMQLLEIRASSKTEELIAQAQFKEADARVKYAEAANARDPRAVPELEYKTYLAQRERFEQEMKKAGEDRQAAQKELEKLKVLSNLHQICSLMDGEVVKIHKREGEAIKQAEPLFTIARLDRLKVEGFCKVHQASSLRAGAIVLVEPELQGAQEKELLGHTHTITDLAISKDGSVLGSASLDNTAILWSWPDGSRIGTLPHPGAVLAIDVTPQGNEGEYLVVTGCEDGKIRAWSKKAGRILGPLWTVKAHEGVVRCVRIDASSGRLASGGEDRKLGLWSLATGSHLGWVHSPGAWKQSAHQGAVSDIRLGSEGCLLSYGTDNVARVWTGTATTFTLAKEHRGRTGEVTRLGPSPDGNQLLFDHGDELRLIHARSGSVLGVLNGGKGVGFQGFATFSPSGRLIVSHSADGRCQVWRSPQQSVRDGESASTQALGGNEIAYYRLPRSLEMKCGLFAPDETVFFSGGTDRIVRAWRIPAAGEWQPRPATLTFVASAVEPGSELVRIHAEMDNRAPRTPLRAGTYVNVKAFPSLLE